MKKFSWRRIPPSALGLIAAGVGSASLFGLLRRNFVLSQIRSEYAPAQFNDALCIVLLGFGLALARSRQKLAAGLGAGAILISALTFAQYVVDFDAGIDRLFFEPWAYSPVPGRIAPNAAVSLLMIGIAVWLLSRGRRFFSVAALGAISFALAGSVLVGYLAGVPEFFAWGSQNRMALLTSIGLILLGGGAVAEAGRCAEREQRRAWWGPLVAAVAISAAGLVLWNALRVHESDRVRAAVRADARIAQAEISANIRQQLDSLRTLAARTRGSDPDLPSAESVVAGGVGRVEWFSLEEARTPPSYSLTPEADQERQQLFRQALSYAHASRSSAVVGPFNMSDDGKAILLVVPVIRAGEARGLLATGIRSDAIFPSDASLRLATGLNLEVLCDSLSVYRRYQVSGSGAPMAESISMALPGPVPWRLVATPGPSYLAAGGTELPEVVLGVSLLTALLLAVSAQFSQQETARAERLEAVVRSRTAELRRVLRGLSHSNRAKDRFIAMLGHELRNPLGAILAASELIRRGDEQHDRALELIETEGGHLRRILDDLLDISRISRDQLPLDRKTVDLGALVRDAAASQQMMVEEKAVMLDVRVPSRPIWINGDATRIRQVVGNLLANAAKFSGADGRIRVEAYADSSAGFAAVHVADQGQGIDPAMLPDIFEPFVRSEESVGSVGAGLGLGLSIAKGLVKAHDGRIRAHSEGLGWGAEFIVELPLAVTPDVDPGADDAVAELDAPHSRAPAASVSSVLLIEDHQPSAEMMGRLISRFGYDVVVAANGAEGIEAALQQHPDLVLCDLGLPEMNGYEVASRLRSFRETLHVPLIAISGYGQDHDVARATEAGFTEHLLKPVSPTELRKLLVRHLGEGADTTRDERRSPGATGQAMRSEP